MQHLRPLNLKTVADAISMHESTVSRVTANKYMATSRGIFELKYFFTSSIASSDGGEAHSAEAVRHRIKQLIDAESANDVLSDDTIVERLREAGIDIARRTVAKYREAMRIPSSVQRRRDKQAMALSDQATPNALALTRGRRLPSVNQQGLAIAPACRVGTATGGQSMPFRVSGKNIDVGEALRERISARVLEALEKYFDGGYSGHVTVGKEAFGFRTECVVHLDSGIVLRAEAMAADAYLSADQAARQLEKRLRRYQRRLKDITATAAATAARRTTCGDRRAELRDRGARRTTSEDEVADVQPGHHRRIDHRAEAAVGQRGGDRARHDRRAGRWFSAMPATAGSIWSIAAPTAMSAGSILPPCRPKAADRGH